MQPGTTRFEVRPRARRNAVLAGLGCGIFTIAGFAMIFSGEEILAGLLAVAFFGGFGWYGVDKLLRREVTMVLSRDGIEQCYPEGTTFIPWSEVERVGIVRIFTNKMVGIRLRSHDHYLGNMTPALADHLARTLPYLKLMARGASLLDVSGGAGVWVQSEARGLGSFGKVDNLAEALSWARERYGYDLVLSWAELDRAPGKFVALLETYRSAA